MSCRKTKVPILTNRTGLKLAKEGRYGQTHDELREFPVYNFDIVNMGSSQLQSSIKNTEYAGRPYGYGPFYDVRIDSYFDDSGSWKTLLFGCGFYEKNGQLVLSDYPGSFYAECNYGRSIFPLKGNRGSFNIAGSAGGPVRLNYAGRALFSENTTEYSSGRALGEIEVPLLEKSDLSIMMPDGTKYAPVVQNLEISYDRDVFGRIAGGDRDASVVRIEHKPLFEFTIKLVAEYDPDIDWAEYFVKQSKFKDFTVKIGDICRIKATPGGQIILDNLPTFGDTNNIRVVNLQFKLIGQNSLLFELL